MITALLQFYRKHKRRLFIAVGLLTTGYLVFQYINNRRIKFIEYQQHLIKQKIKKKYQQTQQDCVFTIIALLPSLSGAIYRLMPVENITKQLLTKRSNKKKALGSANLSEFTNESDGVVVAKDDDKLPENDGEATKSQLWKELKIKSLTRLLTLVYSNCLLIILVRLQLNILARKDYLETSIEAANVTYEHENPQTNDNDDYIVEQSFLSLSWWLLNHGYISIYEKCREAIELVFKDINAKTELTFNEFSVLVAKTQEIIDKNFLQNNDFFLEKCMLPSPDLEALVIIKSSDNNLDDQERKEETVNQIVQDENFRLLVEETRDYINNESVNFVVISMITSSISKFLNNCSNVLFNVEVGEPDEVEIELITKRFKLVKILSIIIKESNRVSESSNSNEYVQAMNSIPELEEYAASVYSDFAI